MDQGLRSYNDQDNLPVYLYELLNGDQLQMWYDRGEWQYERLLSPPVEQLFSQPVLDWPDGIAEIIEAEIEATDTSEPFFD